MSYSYCPSGLNYFKANGLLTAKPNIGDIVFYDWLGDRKMDHVGIYLQDNGDHNTFMAIEGNTAVNNDSNGGKVMIRSRLYSMATFAHPTQLIPNPSKPE